MEEYNPLPVKPSNYDEVEFSVEIVNLLTKQHGDREDVVYQVDWKLIGTIVVDPVEQLSTTTELTHSVTFLDDELDSSTDFTAFSSLTKEQVKSWIESRVPMTHLEYTVCNGLQQSTKTPSAKELPWN